MIKLLRHMILGHEHGRISECPFTNMTYIHCNVCDNVYYAYPTIKAN